MAKRNRKQRKRSKAPALDSRGAQGRRRSWSRWAMVIALLVMGGLTLRTFQRTNSVDLPPLGSTEADGQRVPSVDMPAVADFAQQLQLPDLPDLNTMSWEAARDFHQALRGVAERPTDGTTWGQLGRVFQSHQFPAKALACYEQAEKLQPKASQWPYYIGRVHADTFEIDAAIEAYERSADRDPAYAPTFLALGNLYQQNGQSDRARSAFERLVTLRPDWNHGYLGLGQLDVEEQQYDRAIPPLEAALARDPRDFRVHSLIGQAYQRTGQLEKANYHLSVVDVLNRPDEQAKQVVFFDPLYHRMLSSNSTDAALTERMRAAKGTRQRDVAVRLAQELVRRQPNDAERLLDLASVLKQAKRNAEAMEATDRAIALMPNLPEAQLMKAQLLLIARRHRQAMVILDGLVNEQPDLFDAHYYRGTAFVLEGAYQQAADAFRQALRIKEESARAHVALAETLNELGQRDQAMAEYRRALKLDPTNARARKRLEQSEH